MWRSAPGIQFAFDAGFNVLKEFYPEIERKFSAGSASLASDWLSC